MRRLTCDGLIIILDYSGLVNSKLRFFTEKIFLTSAGKIGGVYDACFRLDS